MLRRALSLLIVVTLVLGWTGAIASAGCGAGAGEATAGLAAVGLTVTPGGCGNCGGDEDNKGQPQQGCAVLACTAGCVAGPATVADPPRGSGRIIALAKAAPALDEALRARAIPPDRPPPR